MPGSPPLNGPNPDATSVVGALALADTGVQLRRLRWAVRAALTLGVAASVAANVLHARPNPISQIIAAWPPLALLLTVELISRVPHHRRSLGVIRIAATAVIAAIATWVSYWHLVGVAARYGETEAGAAHLLPISVDGLVIVASVSLVELTARIRAATTDQQPLTTAETAPPAATCGPHDRRQGKPLGASTAGRRQHSDPDSKSADANTGRSEALRPASHHVRAASRGLPGSPGNGDNEQPPHQPGYATVVRRGALLEKPPDERAEDGAGGDTSSGDGPVPPETAAAVAYWYRRDPGLHPAEIAAKIGRSERTVRRYWPPPAATSPPVNTAAATDLAASVHR